MENHPGGILKQFTITPAAGKRLIARALAVHPIVQNVLKTGTLVIIAGTTNGYVAEEIFAALHRGDGFSRKRFFHDARSHEVLRSSGA